MKTALLVIDVQMALAHDDAAGAERSCPEAETNIAKLMAHFRNIEGKVIHIHHHGLDADDPFHSDAPGSAVQHFAKPEEGEVVYIKNGSSSFIGTSLEKDLKDAGITRLITCGATANHCVETATRMASDLGFETYYAADAVWAYSATGPDGKIHSADTIHSTTLANLQGEFATVLTTDKLLEL